MGIESVLHFRRGAAVQELLAKDKNPAPEVLRMESARDMGREDISLDRYYSRAWHEREVQTVWRKTWQMACRVEDIPKVGDTEVYDIVHDSLLIVRTGEAPGDIRAYINSCLHRGTILRTEGGPVRHIKCPVHGMTWALDGSLAGLPCAWDFPQIDKAKFGLPQAKVGLWAGFVFVNFDDDCEPLESYLECLPEHFKAFKLEDRYKAVHGGKVLPCNWKLAPGAGHGLGGRRDRSRHRKPKAHSAWHSGQQKGRRHLVDLPGKPHPPLSQDAGGLHGQRPGAASP